MATSEQYRRAATQMNTLAELTEEEEATKESIENELEIELKFVGEVLSEYDEINKLSDMYKINASEARNLLDTFPQEYVVEDKTIPDLIKTMRKTRRELKGEQRDKMSKAIDTMIDAYTDHLYKCIDSIHWLSPYKETLLKMRFNEKDLHKLHKMKDLSSRREVVDALCKYWEAELEQRDMVYGKEYATLSKTMSSAKKEFRDCIAKVSSQSVTKSKKERQEDFIIKMVCEHQGIGARQIHERMPTSMYKISSPQVISKMIKKLDIVSLNGAYYKVPSEIKKNIWAYTAAFIDSDGYITLDRNMNPRVGLVATGERGKAFMMEMHKSIGFGRMHLDQKSPQDTRLINRLNFYSQNDVRELLTKCLPHFRLKKGNAELLLELIRMKKSYKKADWYKQRCDEIFKLMKWENHKDHVGFDWAKENINLDDIQKYKDNCKISVMDELENIGGIITKSEEEMQKKGLSWYAKGDNPKKFLLDKDGVRHAAGVAVYKGDKILIVERSAEEDTMIGLWEFAGGKIEELDEFNEDGTPDAEKVCMIEAGEELGLFKKPSSKVGVHFDKNMTPPKKYHCFRVDVEDDWNPTLSFEHSDYKWITLEELKAYPENQMSHHVRFLADKL